jgi:hypothetical protein
VHGAGMHVGLAGDRWLGPVWVGWCESGLWGLEVDVGHFEMDVRVTISMSDGRRDIEGRCSRDGKIR